jgi:hypothetical protein
MPSPYVPFLDLELLKSVFLDALGIAIISYVISLSMARMVALKLKYQVRGSAMGANVTHYKSYKNILPNQPF